MWADLREDIASLFANLSVPTYAGLRTFCPETDHGGPSIERYRRNRAAWLAQQKAYRAANKDRVREADRLRKAAWRARRKS